LYGAKGEYDSSLAYARRQIRVEPTARNAAVLAANLAGDGKLDSARTLMDSLLRVRPDAASNAQVAATRFLIAYARGQDDSAAAIATALDTSPQATAQVQALGGLSRLAALRGELRRSVALDQQIDRILTQQGAPADPDGLSDAEADIRFRGRAAEGVHRLDAIVAGKDWAALHPADRPYLRVATLYALAHRADRARQVLARFEQEDPGGFHAPIGQPDLATIRGEIALAEGKPADALSQFRLENPLNGNGATRCDGCMAYDLARAFDAAGQADSALAEYQRYLSIPAGLRRDDEYRAAVQKRLGEIYDQRNDTKNAISHYAAFVDQWAHADAELQPVVNDVRRRLGELRGREGQ
ncbi:MAG TPA: hypothetical protein VFU45_04185, partial [Gemmatimonadales bacterium]|nr:hypothetical protein [Gemmatimonadales bacterium]